jgi:hypothetical protein
MAAWGRLRLSHELGREGLRGCDPQPGQPHAEQRPAPLREQGLCGDAAAVLEHLSDLRRRVSGARQGRGKLGMGDLRPCRRL